MKSTVRKILCVAIAMVLAVGLLPVSALASGSTPPCSCTSKCTEVADANCTVCQTSGVAACEYKESEQSTVTEESKCSCNSKCTEEADANCSFCQTNGVAACGYKAPESTCTCTSKCTEVADANCTFCQTNGVAACGYKDTVTCSCTSTCSQDTFDTSCSVCNVDYTKCTFTTVEDDPKPQSEEPGTETKEETTTDDSGNKTVTKYVENSDGTKTTVSVSEYTANGDDQVLTKTTEYGDNNSTTVTNYGTDGTTVTSTEVTTYAEDGTPNTTKTDYTTNDDGNKVETVSVNGTPSKTTEYSNGEPIQATIYDTDGTTPKYVEKYNQDLSGYDEWCAMEISTGTIVYAADEKTPVKITGSSSVSNGNTSNYEIKYSDFTSEEIAQNGGNTPTTIESYNEYTSGGVPVSASTTYRNEDNSYIASKETSYDSNGNPKTVYESAGYNSNEKSVETHYTYDSDGKLESSDKYTYTNNNGTISYDTLTTTTYKTTNGESLPTSVTTYAVEGTAYDKITSQTTQTVQTTEYDDEGKALYTTTTTYDETGEKPVESVTVDTQGNTNTTTYDETGEKPVKSVTVDSNGNETTTEYTYSEGKTVKTTTNPDGSVSRLTTEQVDDNTIKYTSEAKAPGATEFTTTYVTTVDSAKGETTIRKYDSNGKLYSTVVGTATGQVETFEDTGNIATTVYDSDTQKTTVTTTDNAGKKLNVVTTTVDGDNTVITTEVYDDTGENVSSTTTRTIYPVGADGTHKEVIVTVDSTGTTTVNRTYNQDGSYKQEGFTPEVVAQSNTAYTGYAPLMFRSNDEFVNFLYVTVDGVTVDSKYYSAAPGSILVTLNQSYLNTLGAGTHTVGIVSTNGTASASFSISAETVAMLNGSSPRTGDSSDLTLFSALLLVSLVGLVALPATLRKKAD